MHTLRLIAVLSCTLLFPACTAEAHPAHGTWDLDGAATAAPIEAMMKEELAKIPEGERKMAESMMGGMVEMMKNMKASMAIKPDGTFTVDADAPDGTKSKIAGKWTFEGDKLTMVGTEEGQDKEETKVATIKDGTMVIAEEQDGKTFEMIFKKKS